MDTSKDFSTFMDDWLCKKPFGEVFHPATSYLLNNRGKLLRPTLVLSTARDLGEFHHNHLWLALSIELHHNYTLVHDDLPCMDNDDLRRGKPTLHKAFGEAHALLVGDILLSESYATLANIHHSDITKLIRGFNYATSSKGLILGQICDLEMKSENISQESILRMYELKTARLFQLALVGSIILTSKSTDAYLMKQALRLGSVCGILFQLLDDYQDWHVDKKSDFNFFRVDEKNALQSLKLYQEKFINLKSNLQTTLPTTMTYLSSFLRPL